MNIANNHIYAMEKRYLSEYLETISAEISEETRDEKYKVFLDSVEMEAEKKKENPYSIIENQAVIQIKGVLKNRPQSFIEYLFGIDVTNYADVINAIEHANNNDSIKSIVFVVDSPGGAVLGVDQAAQAIANSEKTTKAVIVGMAASGAYWLASQADYIIASSPMSLVGSIGVVTTMSDSKGYYAKYGIVVETITSDGAENKRPDIKTQEGINIIKEELNQIHAVFVRRIAEGREVSEQYVRDNFGQGGTMTAENGLKVNMVDFVEGLKTNEISSQDINSSELNAVDLQQKEVKTMEIKNVKELKATFPGLVAEVQKESFDAGLKAGIETEKKRIEAHSQFAEMAPAAVLKNIVDGKEFDAVSSAQYQKEMFSKNLKSDRVEDNLEIEAPEGGEEENELNGMASVFQKMIDENGGE
jgi:signal peptide peptidase SppA